MLLFIDYEHASGRDRKFGERMLAARAWITYRLEDLSMQHCHLVRYDRIDDDLIAQLQPSAIFISGNSVAPDAYDNGEVEALHQLIRTTDRPIFGFCGGWQVIADVLGAPVTDLPVPQPLPTDGSVILTDRGHAFEYGYYPVEVANPGHPLLEELPERPIFRHAHGLHVCAPPTGFETLASTESTPVQLAVHDERRIVGTQFHPEYWTNEHPEGRTVIRNFLDWAVGSPT